MIAQGDHEIPCVAEEAVLGGDMTGKAVIPAGTSHKQTDIELEKMNYLVEGVVGSV